MSETVKVLVVDDDATIRDVLCEMLALEGMEVAAAVDGESALEAVPVTRPDVVFLDVMMPGMGGHDVCRRLKALPRPPKVIMVTAKSDVDDEWEAMSAGADAYLRKPFSPLEMLRLVEDVTSGSVAP